MYKLPDGTIPVMSETDIDKIKQREITDSINPNCLRLKRLIDATQPKALDHKEPDVTNPPPQPHAFQMASANPSPEFVPENKYIAPISIESQIQEHLSCIHDMVIRLNRPKSIKSEIAKYCRNKQIKISEVTATRDINKCTDLNILRQARIDFIVSCKEVVSHRLRLNT